MRNPAGPATDFLLKAWRDSPLTHTLAGIRSIATLRANRELFEAYEEELRVAHDGILTTPFQNFALPFKGFPLHDDPDLSADWQLHFDTVSA